MTNNDNLLLQLLKAQGESNRLLKEISKKLDQVNRNLSDIFMSRGT